MLKIGDFNTLKVLRMQRGGYILESGEPKQPEIYLPKREVEKPVRPGSEIRVFVFNESKQILGATTSEPLARVGEFAALRVKDITSFGAFLDWGIGKDLFVPRKFWLQPLHRDTLAIVYLKLDYEKWGVMGSCEVERFLREDTEELESNQEVQLLLYEKTRLGYKVIIDNSWPGLLYHGDIFEPVCAGDIKSGFVKKVREDGQVDVVLHPQGFRASSDAARDTLLEALKQAGGFLPLHDKSEPGEIYSRLHISKKLFKKTIGVLYREGLLILSEEGISLSSEKRP